MGLMDFFTPEAGQKRRNWLDAQLGGMWEYVPPELRPFVALGNEMNPVTSMERAGQDARRVVAPNVSGWDRMAAAGDMASNMAGVVAPMVAASKGAVPAVQAAEDALMGWSASSPAAFAARDFMADEFGGVGFGDDVAARGAQIMDMLKAGRGADVTDEMLDMGDATLNARLNEWLFNNYDLPMDAASRAARKSEMGFDANLYHGTDKAFPYFRVGDGSNTGVSAPAVFLSDSRKVAETYGDTVLDVTARMEQPVSVDFDGRSVGYFGEQRFTPSELTREMASIRDDVRKGYLDPDSDLRYDLEGAGFDYNYNTDIDAVEMRNVVDSAGSMFGGDKANNYAVFDPRNIRLKSARFDPRLIHLRNLSASLAGLGLMQYGQPQE